jgi:4-aminobutyrate aminotransferase-like enzyme
VERLYEYTQNAGDWFHKVVNMLSRPNADIDVALREARAGFAAKRPKSQAVAAEAERYMPGGNTRSVLYHGPFPVRAVSGEGATIVDADGHRYVNLNGEHTAGIYGHSHPVIKAAVAQALDNGFNLAAHNLYEIELARLICERFKSIELVRFTNSGTEANLLAIAIARKFTGRSKVIALKEAFCRWRTADKCSFSFCSCRIQPPRRRASAYSYPCRRSCLRDCRADDWQRRLHTWRTGILENAPR